MEQTAERPMERPVGGGRPRDHRLDLLIRSAVVDLLGEGGVSAASLDAVADRAGVGRATIYRRWSSKRQLIADAVAASAPELPPQVDEGSLDRDVVVLLDRLTALLDTSLALAVRRLLPETWSWPELAADLRSRVLEPWELEIRAVARRAHGRGEVLDATEAEIVVRTAALALCAEWLADAGRFADADRARTRTAELVDALIR